MAALTCKAIPIIGMLLGQMTCESVEPAPTGKAPFCELIRYAGRGEAKKPSRRDTGESAEYMNRVRAAYDKECRK